MRRLLCVAVVAVGLGDASPANATIVQGSKALGAIWWIGDSITQGNADGDFTETVRSTLYNKLMAAGYAFTYTGHYDYNSEGLPATGNDSDPASDLYQFHSGVSGSVIGTNWVAPNGAEYTGMTQNITMWWASSVGRLSVVPPNVILILIGSNDADVGLDITNAPARLAQLISTIYTLPGVGNPTILVGTLPPNRDSLVAPQNVAVFNVGVPGVVQCFQNLGDDVYIVDQFTLLNENFSAAMTPGKLHPNAVGNDYMAQNWLNTIQSYVGASVPVAPCSLSAAPANTQVALFWSVVPGANQGYTVKRSLVSGGPYVCVATNLAATCYTDTNVVNLTTYYYVTTAVNALGESTNSNEIAAIPAVLPPPVVTAALTGSQVGLNWPADYIGWRLQTQTNAFVAGVSTNWTDVPNSTLTNQLTIPIDAENVSVFFRLAAP